MKYKELEKLLKQHGCYHASNKDHPIWYSPKTKKYFRTSHHKLEEVKRGTLRSILRDAGIE